MQEIGVNVPRCRKLSVNLTNLCTDFRGVKNLYDLIQGCAGPR